MRILAIETSCDETAISIVEAEGEMGRPQFKVLSHLISSQIELHAPWGGVVPSLAKREHSKNLIPLLREALEKSKLAHPAARAKKVYLTVGVAAKLHEILTREPELLEQFLQFIPTIDKPEIDAIAVTRGPGLEPALWVGINFAKALQETWGIPVVPVNHLEGHLASSLVQEGAEPVQFPLLALIVSGGHTELVLAKSWLRYELIGATRDDAAGEAFDKVARILDLPYPGGPAIGKLALHGSLEPDYKLPRPMINSGDFDFSFSGLKTAVLYLAKSLGELSHIQRANIARQFQQAVIDVLISKTLDAIEKFHPQTLVIGGGVIANQELRREFELALAKTHPEVNLRIPDLNLTTDNATMIATAAYLHLLGKEEPADPSTLSASGNLPLSE